MANTAVSSYMQDKTDPGDTLFRLMDEQQKTAEAKLTFEHCRRACEKVNVGLATKYALANRQDRGVNFPLAKAESLAERLGISPHYEEFSKTAASCGGSAKGVTKMKGKKKTGPRTKTASADVAAVDSMKPISREKYLLGAEAERPTTYEALRKLAHAGGLTNTPAAPVRENTAGVEIRKVSALSPPNERESLGLKFEFLRAMQKLGARIRHHVVDEKRDPNRVAVAVIRHMGKEAARAFLVGCKEAGVHVNGAECPIIDVPSVLPGALQVAIGEAARCTAKIARLLEVSGCTPTTKAAADLDVREITMVKAGALEGSAVGRDAVGYFLYHRGYRSASFPKVADLSGEFGTKFRDEVTKVLDAEKGA